MKILEEKIFERERKYYEEILNGNYDYATEKVYVINILKIIEYTLEFTSNLFAGYRYFETKEENEKNAIASLFRKNRNFLKNKISIFNKISLGKNNIYKILNELRLIRNLLMHLKYETLSDNIREEIRISYIKNFKDEETKEIWNIIHKLYNKLREEIVEQFNSEAYMYKEFGTTYLVDGIKRFEVSPFLIVENNNVYSLSSIKRKSEKEKGFETTVFYNSLSETIKINEDNIIDKINSISKSLKYSIEIETNKYLYLNEEFQMAPSIYRYDNSKDNIICELKAETVNPNKIIFGEKYMLLNKEKSKEFMPIKLKIEEDERERIKIKLYKKSYLEKSKENIIDEIEEFDIEKKEKGEIKVELHITKSKEIKDNVRKGAKLVITNTGNVHKESRIVLKSHGKIFIYKDDGTKLKKNEMLTIYLEPNERKIIDFYFIPKIFGEEVQRANQKCGVLNKAIYIGMINENGELRGEWNKLYIYKRFEPTKLIGRKETLSLIQNELRKENFLKINNYMIWYIMGLGGAGKTKFSETVASIAHEYGYNVLEIPVLNPSKINQDSKTANYHFTESIQRKNDKEEEETELSSRIRTMQETTKKGFEEKIEEFLKKYIINKIKKAEKGLFLIIDDCQYILPIEKMMIGNILDCLNEYETVKDVKVLLLSRMDKEPIKAEMITKLKPMKGFDEKEDIEEMIKNIFDPNNFPPEFVENIMNVPKHLPFYLKRFLQILYIENKIYFKDGKWSCLLEKIVKEDFKTDHLINIVKSRNNTLNTLIHMIAIFPEQSYEDTRKIMKELGYEDIDITNSVEELKNIDIVKQEGEKLYLSHDITTENIENSFEDKLLKEVIDTLMKKWIDSVETIEDMDDLDEFIELMDRLIIIHKMIEKVNNSDYLYDYAVKMLDIEEKVFFNIYTHYLETDIRKYRYFKIIENIQKKLESEKYKEIKKIKKMIESLKYKCTETDTFFQLFKLNYDFHYSDYEYYLNERYKEIEKYYKEIHCRSLEDNGYQIIRFLATYSMINSYSWMFTLNEFYLKRVKFIFNEIENEYKDYLTKEHNKIINISRKILLGLASNFYSSIEKDKHDEFFKEQIAIVKEQNEFKKILYEKYLLATFIFPTNSMDITSLFSSKNILSLIKDAFILYKRAKVIIVNLKNSKEKINTLKYSKKSISKNITISYFYLFVAAALITANNFFYLKRLKKILKWYKYDLSHCLNTSLNYIENSISEYNKYNGQNITSSDMQTNLFTNIILNNFIKENKMYITKKTKKRLNIFFAKDKISFINLTNFVCKTLNHWKPATLFSRRVKKNIKDIKKILEEILNKESKESGKLI